MVREFSERPGPGLCGFGRNTASPIPVSLASAASNRLSCSLIGRGAGGETRGTMTKHALAAVLTGFAVAAVTLAAAPPPLDSWSPRAAAGYLDGRQTWWQAWPTAQRDHDTACVSCHTAVPYALARPALRRALAETEMPAPERRMIDNIVKRVRMWKDVEPFYPDQVRGLPKSSESRGTEAVMNALILSTRDEAAGRLSDDTRLAFANMWALQFKAGDLTGAWAWLQFHIEPWEGQDSAYFGAALAAVAVGSAPDGYAADPQLKDRIQALRDYLEKGVGSEPLLNRLMALWASAKLPPILADDERKTIITAVCEKQQADGGWGTADLGAWKRIDGSVEDTASDGYATGLVAYVLSQAAPGDEHLPRALGWLAGHQDAKSGMWRATSLNKQRDPATDVGKFMSDAATAYAVLALTSAR
jgi:squalene-hopene/tetraprenyl-beta-curcumene cyclase